MALECMDEILVNFTKTILCHFTVSDPGSENYDVDYGTTTKTIPFIFQRGTADSGRFLAIPHYSVTQTAGGQPGAETTTAPDGVTVSVLFSPAPDFSDGPREDQTIEVSVTTTITEAPDPPDNQVEDFEGEALQIRIEVGLDR